MRLTIITNIQLTVHTLQSINKRYAFCNHVYLSQNSLLWVVGSGIFLQDGVFKTYPSHPTGWTHVVINYYGPNDGQGVRIFYNGTEAARDTSKDSDQSAPGDGRIVVERRSTGSDQDYASADVDELIFFNRSLSTSEIRT